ncbi:polymer-forming cytoskeletal protein [candidate division TA06 bacterium]|uniref:Polymer-forming cytoskeletal protein n=1 Tax=candidate division TA06 bacterium TaxID=2250710 RepID=A0A523UZA7_UNCT6|nr:MAG: polymer-forming cytoskeletal protein [candidate division TA06 bacterium]
MTRASVGRNVSILLAILCAACAAGQTEEAAHPSDSASTVADTAVQYSPVAARTPVLLGDWQEPLDRDLMTAGGVVRVLTPVNGDLFVGGGQVTIETSVAGDIWVSGGIVSVGGSCEGDVRAAGYQVTLNGLIRSSGLAFCRSFTQAPESEVWGDLRFNCGKASIGGTVNGRLSGNAHTVRIDGTVRGGVSVEAERVMVGSNALIEGDLVYESANEAMIDQAATILGSAVHHVPESREVVGASREGLFNFDLGMRVVWFIGMLIVGLIMSAFSPNVLMRSNEMLKTSPWVCLLTGFVLLVCLPAILLVLLVAVVGWPLMLLLSLFYVAGIAFSGIFVGLTLGKALLRKVRRARESIFWPMALGILILAAISSIPFVGFLLRLVIVMLGLGAVAASQWRFFKESRGRKRLPEVEVPSI